MSVGFEYDAAADQSVYTFKVEALSGSSCGAPDSLSIRWGRRAGRGSVGRVPRRPRERAWAGLGVARCVNVRLALGAAPGFAARQLAAASGGLPACLPAARLQLQLLRGVR